VKKWCRKKWADVDFGIEKLGDHRAKRIGFGKPEDDVPKLEVDEYVLHIWREAVEVGIKVRCELLVAGASFQIAEREQRRVVECLTEGGTQRGPLRSKPAAIRANAANYGSSHSLTTPFFQATAPHSYRRRKINSINQTSSARH